MEDFLYEMSQSLRQIKHVLHDWELETEPINFLSEYKVL